MFDREEFDKEKLQLAAEQSSDRELAELALRFIKESDRYNHGYQWNWLGMPIIQMPADIVAIQEIIWENKPDVIIETGIAWGGSVVLNASILDLIGNGRVIAVDRTLPQKNIDAIIKYPFSKRVTLIEGSSVDPNIITQIHSHINAGDKVMVQLDSNHTHDHVLQELREYGAMVTPGQFLIVSDTIVEFIPEQTHRPRPWGRGNNPKSALDTYLKETDRFERDLYINDKILATFNPDGYMRCVA